MARLILRSAHLILFLLLIKSNAVAQISFLEFSYSEKILSNYAAILNNGEEKRVDSSSHEGKIFYRFHSKDTVLVEVITRHISNTSRASAIPDTVFFAGTLDINHRLNEIIASLPVIDFIFSSANWIGELHFFLPQKGDFTERKFDGDFKFSYSKIANGNSTLFNKTAPEYIRPEKSNQAVIFDNYLNRSNFNSHGLLTSFKLSESKRQILGRRTLACIERELVLSSITPEVMSQFSLDLTGQLNLYQRLSENERRLRIAKTLLGKENWSGIKQKLANVEHLSGEQQFRLKSMIRSLLILDSIGLPALQIVFNTLPLMSIQRDIIENAVMESQTRDGARFVNDQLRRAGNDYSRLKDLVIRITTTNSFSSDIVSTLKSVLANATDEDTKNLISLALSNYALEIRDSDPDNFINITDKILSPHKNVLSDTLQYLYLVGNAGIEKESATLLSLLKSDDIKKDVVFAFRHFRAAVADSLIKDYLLNFPGGYQDIQIMLANRKADSTLIIELSRKIILADSRGDSSWIKVLEYLLDHRFEYSSSINSFIKTEFTTDVYRKEMEEFKVQNDLCRQKK